MTRFRRMAALPLVAAMTTSMLMAPGASAQDPLGAPAREIGPRVMLQASRAQLGVMLGGAEQIGERTGVRVEQVIPGSAAERAGIRPGDLVLSVEGRALGPEPGQRLTRLMTDVQPGDTVTIVLHREGRDHTVRVVTDRSGAPLVLRPGQAAGPLMVEAFRDLLPATGQTGRHRLELVALNPGLGRYFGVEAGVLVANVAADSPLGLEPGDVIVSIGGRAVRDPAHARAIMASYRGDEEAELQVVRDRRTITVRAVPGARR
jgi:S1-C subfamily serine protease